MPLTVIPVSAKRSRCARQGRKETRSERDAIPVKQEKLASKDPCHAVRARKESLQRRRDLCALSVLLVITNLKTSCPATVVSHVLQDGDQRWTRARTKLAALLCVGI